VNNLLSTLLLRAAALGLSLAAGLAAAEALVRVFIPQDLGVLAPWYESHPVYRFRHYPDMDAVRTWGHPYRLRTNSQGIRSDRDEAYDSPLETRIVVHGDSLTLGVGVENEDTFVHRTERRLLQRFDAIDVLNLGVSGHGPDQQYLLFQEEGRRYSPRICIIAVCLTNDLDEVAWSRAAFRLDGDRLTYVPYDPPLAKKLAETPAYRWLASRSHLLVLARYNLVDARIQAREFAAQDMRTPPLRLALAIYREFIAAVKHAGAVPVVVLLPSRGQIAQRRMLPVEESLVSPAMLRDALLQFCAANAITCLDALDGFGKSDVPFDELFIPGDDHFSAAGHRVITDVITEPLARTLDSLSER
jgi:hypothetical protein